MTVQRGGQRCQAEPFTSWDVAVGNCAAVGKTAGQPHHREFRESRADLRIEVTVS